MLWLDPTFAGKVQSDWLRPLALWRGSTPLLLETEEWYVISSVWTNVRLSLCRRGMASLLRKIMHSLLQTWGNRVLKQTFTSRGCAAKVWHFSAASLLLDDRMTRWPWWQWRKGRTYLGNDNVSWIIQSGCTIDYRLWCSLIHMKSWLGAYSRLKVCLQPTSARGSVDRHRDSWTNE